MQSAPFARANQLMTLIKSMLGKIDPFNAVARQAALAAIPEYRWRGKGRGATGKRYGSKPGKYMPHQGKQECERRRLRMARLGGFKDFFPMQHIEAVPFTPIKRECPSCKKRSDKQMGHYNNQHNRIKCVHCGHEWKGRILATEIPIGD